jgi:hypothetical protein
MPYMDSREAVAWLNIYSDELVSLSLLLNARTLQDDTDDEICEVRDGLEIAIVEKQKEAMLLAHDILTTRNRRSGASDPLVNELSVAIQRYVLADAQASEALEPPPETYAEALARIIEQGTVEAQEAEEAKEEANVVSPSASEV